MTADGGCLLGDEPVRRRVIRRQRARPGRDARPGLTCPICPVRSAGYFCDFSIATLQDFQRIKRTLKYTRGTRLFLQGQKPRGVFMVCQGRLKLSMSSLEGKTLILRVVRAGEIVGLGCTLSGARHEFTAEALDDCRLSFVDRQNFRQFIRQHNDACARVIQQLASKCTAARNRVRSLVFSRTAESRLARVLLDWSTADSESIDQAKSVMPPLSHETIAELIGTSRETATRLLKKLKRREIVEVSGQHITINNAAALKVIASMATPSRGFAV